MPELPTHSRLALVSSSAIVQAQKLQFNAIFNPGCSGTIILPDGHLHTFGGDVLSPVRNLQDGRNKIMVRTENAGDIAARLL